MVFTILQMNYFQLMGKDWPIVGNNQGAIVRELKFSIKQAFVLFLAQIKMFNIEDVQCRNVDTIYSNHL